MTLPLQELAWLATAVGAVVAGTKLATEVAAARKTAARDLRWKQAQAARDLMEEMLEDDGVNRIFSLLDYPSAPIQLEGADSSQVVTKREILLALNPRIPARDEPSRTIRESFDNLFYYMSLIEHYTATSLVIPDDLAFPLDYYHWHLNTLASELDDYLGWFGLSRAQGFLNRQRTRLEKEHPPAAFRRDPTDPSR